MARSVTPFLMFDGLAETAINFYVTLFQGSAAKHIEWYDPDEQGKAGSVKRAECVIAGQNVMAIDSPVKHPFTFTPSVSLFVQCETEAELDAAFGQLCDGGAALMPPGNYGFSAKFAWVNDRFGVTWQLNLQ